MSDEKHTTTADDRLSLSSVCVWEGSILGAEMNAFHNTAVTVAGRGSDIADTSLSDLFARKKDTGLISYYQLMLRVTRFKTCTQTEHITVPHRDSFLLCFYHSLAYALVMCGEPIRSTGKIFPTFAEKVFNGTSKPAEKQVESKVSLLFNRIIDKYWVIMFNFYSEFRFIITSDAYCLT